jgi:hypothetical protein
MILSQLSGMLAQIANALGAEIIDEIATMLWWRWANDSQARHKGRQGI